MKNKPPITILILFTLTIIIPIVLFFVKKDFSVINFLKEFSIPAWMLLFSVSWLFFRLQIKKYSHFEKLAEKEGYSNNAILAVAERERRLLILDGLKKLNNAQNSVKSLEIVIAIGAIIAGIIGIIAYFFG